MISSRICPCKPGWHSSTVRLCNSVGNDELWWCCAWWNCEVSNWESFCSLKYSVSLGCSCWDIHLTNINIHSERFTFTCIRSKVILYSDIMITNTSRSCRQKCYYWNTGTRWNCRNVRRITPITFLCLSWCGSTDRWSCACPKFTIYRIVDKRLSNCFTCFS